MTKVVLLARIAMLLEEYEGNQEQVATGCTVILTDKGSETLPQETYVFTGKRFLLV